MASTILRQTVGTSAVQLTASSYPNARGLVLAALAGNTGTVYWGYADTVTTSTGYELPAGAERLIAPAECSDASGVYLIATASSQGVCARAVS